MAQMPAQCSQVEPTKDVTAQHDHLMVYIRLPWIDTILAILKFTILAIFIILDLAKLIYEATTTLPIRS